jgi:UTP--glucose-1-phosphate uridylyltransferase
MRVKNAVITAAGPNQRHLPLQSLVDRDGVTRTVLAILVNEILCAGVDRICIVVTPGDEARYSQAVPGNDGLLHFVPQPEPAGYADAVWQARGFIGDEPFLHLVGDHIYAHATGDSCAARIVGFAEEQACSVAAVRATHESNMHSFGVIGGHPVSGHTGVFRITTVLEKPTPTVAEQKLYMASLRRGYYLAFFGMHVLMPEIFPILQQVIQRQKDASLSAALGVLATKTHYLGLEVSAARYDLGTRYGLLNAQLALALSSDDRDEILSMIVGIVAEHASSRRAGL